MVGKEIRKSSLKAFKFILKNVSAENRPTCTLKDGQIEYYNTKVHYDLTSQILYFNVDQKEIYKLQMRDITDCNIQETSAKISMGTDSVEVIF